MSQARFYKLLVSTSLRSGRRVEGRGEEVSGDLLVGFLDLQRHAFLCDGQVPVPVSPHRRGRNSVRGLARFADGWAVCNTSQLFLYDRDLRSIRRTHSEKRFGDLHSIAARDGVLYVTATASDSILGFDEDFHRVYEWWAGSEPELHRFMDEHPRQGMIWDHDFRIKGASFWDRFHLNHICFTDDGDMIANLPDLDVEPGISNLWNVTQRRFHLPESSTRNPINGRIHDGVVLGDFHYLGHTETGRLLKLDIPTGELVSAVDCSVPLGETTGHPIAREHGWLRGIAHLADEVFVVGQSKLTLFLVDMKDGTRSPPFELRGFAGDLDNPGLAIYCIEIAGSS